MLPQAEVDRRHPAFAQLALDLVEPFERSVKAGDSIRHRAVLNFGGSDRGEDAIREGDGASAPALLAPETARDRQLRVG
jgi:hypothetical protein